MKKKEKVNYLAIGLFIIAGIILVVVGIFFAGKLGYKIRGGYKLNVTYTFLDNLREGHKVRIAGGVDIGFVEEIKLEDDKMVAVLIIENGFQINQSASFHIYSTGIVGMKYVDVQGYDPSEQNYYEPDQYIVGVTPRGMAPTFESLGDLGDILASDENIKDLSVALGTMGEVFSSINQIVLSNQDVIESAVVDLATTLQKSSEMISKFDQTIANLESISEDLKLKLDAVDEDDIEAIVKNIESLTVELNTLVKGFNSDDSVLSLLNDPDIRESMEFIVENLEDFSETLRDKPNAIIFGD